MNLEILFGVSKPIIGMVHLPPLPLSPRWKGAGYDDLIQFALDDARALSEGGADGIILENQNDNPFLSGEVPLVTVAFMAAIGRELKNRITVPLGINILFNDGKAELAVAKAVDAQFIRAEVFVDPSWSDSGYLEPIAPSLQRMRLALDAPVQIFADIQGKYTTPCSPRPLADSARDAQQRGLADAIIVTGIATGKSASLQDFMEVKRAVSIPVLAGSGLTPDNAGELLPAIDGAIIGSYFKKDGKLENPVDVGRVQKMMISVRKAR
jgi:uncharacterized protein